MIPALYFVLGFLSLMAGSFAWAATDHVFWGIAGLAGLIACFVLSERKNNES